MVAMMAGAGRGAPGGRPNALHLALVSCAACVAGYLIGHKGCGGLDDGAEPAPAAQVW
jgi:hypothetical protein